MRIVLRAAATLLAAAMLPAAAAAFPSYFNYQGKLADASGNPLTGTYSFQFDVYDASAGGNLLFSESVAGSNAISVTNGVYSVEIGSLTAGGVAPAAFQAASGEAWLEVHVKAGTTLTGAETLSPRERLAASPFAFRAQTAENLGLGVDVATYTTSGVLQVPSVIVGSTMTVQGSAFSVGGSTFAVTGGNVGIGTASPGVKLDVAGAVRSTSGGFTSWDAAQGVAPAVTGTWSTAPASPGNATDNNASTLTGNGSTVQTTDGGSCLSVDLGAVYRGILYIQGNTWNASTGSTATLQLDYSEDSAFANYWSNYWTNNGCTAACPVYFTQTFIGRYVRACCYSGVVTNAADCNVAEIWATVYQ